LSRAEALEVARTYLDHGHLERARRLGAASPELAQAIEARVLAKNGDELPQDAWRDAVLELSEAMSKHTVWPRLELLACLVEGRRPVLGAAELDRVLRAVLEDEQADDSDRARVLAYDLELRGGFGIQLELERLDSDEAVMDLLQDVAEVALTSGLES
jgi:hypothetical protein